LSRQANSGLKPDTAPCPKSAMNGSGGHKPRKRKSRPEAALYKSDLTICGLRGHPYRL
jgi:hypothetical protein